MQDSGQSHATRASRRFELAERRQRAWSEGDATAVYVLTQTLNGHAFDLAGFREKSDYFGDDGGAWGDYRKQQAGRGVDLRDEHDFKLWGADPAEVLAQGDIAAPHGRKRTWGENTKTSSGTVRWTHLGDAPAVELLASGKAGKAAEGTIAGGDHDLVWLAFHQQSPRYELEAYRDVLSRRGRLAEGLRPIKADGVRLILGLLERGVTHTSTARFFGIRERTVTRQAKNNLNVREFPREGTFEMAETQLATRDDLHRTEGRIADSLNSIQSTVNALLLRWPDSEDLKAAAEWLDEQ